MVFGERGSSGVWGGWCLKKEGQLVFGGFGCCVEKHGGGGEVEEFERRVGCGETWL